VDMTLHQHLMYSIVVDLGEDGDVERMLFGDNFQMETMELELAKCPSFVADRIAWLKLLPIGSYLSPEKGERDLGLRLDGAVHIYLSVEERDEIFNLLKESANEKAKREKSNTRIPKT
jgi:hypothetical protein